MSMHTPKSKTLPNRDSQGEPNPSELSLSIIRQYARNSHGEKRLKIPDIMLFIN
jgi:hypothetical protein